MKAVVLHEHGGVDKLRYEDVPTPRIGETEVLVKIRACALNHLDIWTRIGLPGVSIPMPHICGSDIAGEVVEVGRLVNITRPGDPVVISPGVSCGMCDQCAAGQDNLCPDYKIIGHLTDGGYAEYVKVPEANINLIPDGMGFEEAASIPLVFLTAWHMLVGRAEIRPGDIVLVVAGGSGVGVAAIQIAKLWGAKVIATAGTDEKCRKCLDVGADHSINHSSKDYSKEVRELTAGRGADIVLEHVGTATWDRSIRSLAKNGRLITCGATTGYEGSIDIRHLFIKHLSVLGSFMGTKGELRQVLKLFGLKKLRPVIDSVHPLREAPKAQAMMEERKNFGKIVLRV